MLTLKYVKGGEEYVSECYALKADRCDDGRRRIAAYESEKLQDGPVGYFFGEGPVKFDGSRKPFSGDTLYVMNRFGATVATYHFEMSEAQEEPEAIAA